MLIYRLNCSLKDALPEQLWWRAVGAIYSCG